MERIDVDKLVSEVLRLVEKLRHYRLQVGNISISRLEKLDLFLTSALNRKLSAHQSV